jgi:hypothetical protein
VFYGSTIGVWSSAVREQTEWLWQAMLTPLDLFLHETAGLIHHLHNPICAAFMKSD